MSEYDRYKAVSESRDQLLNTYFHIKADLEAVANNINGQMDEKVVEYAKYLLEIAEACDWKINDGSVLI